MPTDYTQLDAAILTRAAKAPAEFPFLCIAVQAEAQDVAKLDPWGGKSPANVIQRRLQALRKRGLIAYSPKRGWSVVEANCGVGG